MVVFSSMLSISLTTMATVCVVLLMVLRASPIRIFQGTISKFASSRKHIFALAAVFVILVVNKFELWIEHNLYQAPDKTFRIYAFEGELVGTIQKWFEHFFVTYGLTYFYVIVFPALMIASMIIYSYLKEDRLFYAFCYALIINYVVAIPFYLLFPINEVWAYRSNISFLIPDVFPSFETDYRPLSGLNNSFPSLHTSISVTMAFIAFQSISRLWSWIMLMSAGIIIFSIFYLGIHWFSDAIGGVLLGLMASSIGLLFSNTVIVKEVQTLHKMQRQQSHI